MPLHSSTTLLMSGSISLPLPLVDAESWQALLKLRSQLQSERGQAVLECIVNDEGVLRGLGMAQQLCDIAGKPPDVLLICINEGPGSHIRQNAYYYRYVIDREIACIRELQVRSVALVGTGIAAALVGLASSGADSPR